MKKIISLLLISAMAFTFSACGNDIGESSNADINLSSNTSDSKKPNSHQETSISDGENPIMQSGEIQLLAPSTVEYRICCSTQEGFYYISDCMDSLYPRLKYVDYATRQEVYLCSDSSCQHDKESCTAVFPYDEFYTEVSNSQIFAYNNKLFFLSAASDSSIGYWEGYGFAGGFEEGKNAALYQMNLDGTEREKILELEQGQTAEPMVVGEGDNLWFITLTPDIYKNEKTGATLICSKDRKLVKFSLSQRKIIDSADIDNYNNISLELEGVSGSGFIFSGVEYPDGKSRLDYAEMLAAKPTLEEELAHWDEQNAFFDKCYKVFFIMDINTKEIKEIYRQKGFFCDIHQYDDCLYVDSSEYGTTKVDISAGKSEKFTPPEDYMLWGFFGDKIVYIHKTPDWSDNAYYFCDFDSEELIKAEPIVNLSIELAAVIGDKALITTEAEHFFDFGDLYLVSLEDIYSGNKNFEPISAA